MVRVSQSATAAAWSIAWRERKAGRRQWEAPIEASRGSKSPKQMRPPNTAMSRRHGGPLSRPACRSVCRYSLRRGSSRTLGD